MHNTEKTEDRDQYHEPQTLISVRKVRFSLLLTLPHSIFIFNMFVYTDFGFSDVEKTGIVQTWFSQDINLIKRNSSLPE